MANVTAECIVSHEAGLHLRPAALFLQTAGSFEATVKVRNVTRDTAFKNAKSMIDVMSLGVSQGHTIEIEADGDDAEEALKALLDLINSNFVEDGDK